jgi:mono/diheme cytochrome c family protein
MTRQLCLAQLLVLTSVSVCYAAPQSSGAEIFARHCAHCHAAGDEHPGTRQLAATRGQDKGLLEKRNDLAADYVKYIVRHGLKSMPSFLPTAVTDAELDALADHLTGN